MKININIRANKVFNFHLHHYNKWVDNLFLKLDKKLIKRFKPLIFIPSITERRGGKTSYAEWAYVIGLFQSIIYDNIDSNKNNIIIDVGCGTGLLSMAARPYVKYNGCYCGIDVMINDINFCNNHYPKKYNKFIHHKVFNKTYSPNQSEKNLVWDIEDESVDLVTALSVWTHLLRKDAIFYFKEIYRILKPNKRAIITFFIKDKYYDYKKQIEYPKSFYHKTDVNRWIFEKEIDQNWFTTNWTKNSEDAIAINNESLKILLKESGLRLLKYYPGTWKETSGLYFQDILILQKSI